ncbi:MAG: hypothetical protein WDZ45_13660 [Flavobacteriaceae bacterium]
MKHFNLKITYFLVISLFFISCQKEEIDIIDETPGDAITLETPLTNLLLNTTQNNGGVDDFIDGTSCSSIQFPYQVIINGQTITISDETDLLPIANTTAPITIVFPITVVFEDFSTLVVNSQQELNALGQLCETLNEAIDCVELVYPITLFIFNSNNEQTGSVVINSNIDLFLFLSSLEPGVFVQIDFPITVILADGTTVTVTTNEQLQTLIENCEDVVTDPPPNPLDLETVLTTDIWYVSYYFDDEDQTDDFGGYAFTFNSDGTANASNGSNTVPGSWSVTNSSGGQLKLNLDFGVDNPFDELEDDWNVTEFSNEIIKLFDISGGDGSTDYLNFSRTPTQGGGGGGNPVVQELKDILTDGNWFVALYLEDGEDDETSNFNSFSFDFLQNGTVEVSNSQVTLQGTWQVTIDSDDNLELVLNFSSNFPLDELDDDWLVIEFQNNQVKLADDDDSDADILIFEKF